VTDRQINASPHSGTDTSSLLDAMALRVIVADGAMGTMLQAADPSLDDFAGFEGCNEILNVTRPELVASVHRAYLDAGVDAIETNTFGANLANLGEYGISNRIAELARAGAEIARRAADEYATPASPRFVLGSVGPGTKLPTLGHTTFAALRDAYAEQVAGMLDGGIDAVLVETSQDLLQAKSAVIGAKRAMTASGRRVPVFVHVTVETTGTMLLGSEIGAALTALEGLGIDSIGLNCATGPAEMSEHLRYLSRHARIGVSVMPNAGLPELGPNGAVYPLTPDELAEALAGFVTEFGTRLVGGCCGTTPEHLAAVVQAVQAASPAVRQAQPEPGISSLYQPVSFDQDASFLMIGERTNSNGSKAFREAMLSGSWDDCIEIAKAQTREGAHLLDLCVDYVGRDGALDMAELAGRMATASTLPIMLDSTEPPVIRAGLERLGGRCIINSVNFEDGDGPESRFGTVMPMVVEHGAAVVALTIDEQGQARTRDHKVAIAERLIDELTGGWGLTESDIVIDCLTFPIATGQKETRRDGIETIEAIREIKRRHPSVHTTLGISNISFGLNPAARQVLNSVFLAECVAAGLDSAIVHPSKILPMAQIPERQRTAALDLVYDRRREGYDPLAEILTLFEGATAASSRANRTAELAALPLDERLQRRIVDGERTGLEADLDEALRTRPALTIINDTLLAGMKTVGELFGAGKMQLPFVLTSAEVMKAAVAYLEPHMERTESNGGSMSKGSIVLATVKGDVHDIGKNLVDIILSNNGYTVKNIGIKQPITAILDAADEAHADAIGMSGLLVKSTVVMRDNLAEINSRGLADRYPVLLGGAALTRAYVENDLADLFEGDVSYARDAFEGLRLMDRVMTKKKGLVSGTDTAADAAERAKAAERRARHERSARIAAQRKASEIPAEVPARSATTTDNPIPKPPFWGQRVIKGIPQADFAALLDERALFLGQWGLRGQRGGDGPSYEELVESEGRPRLRAWLERLATEKILRAAVSYGYFPCVSEGDSLIVLAEPDPAAPEVARFTFPRQQRDKHLCLADYFRPRESGEVDVVAFQLVTMGSEISRFTANLFAGNAYRDYLEAHGLSVQLTEALAEYWHQRIRAELRFADGGAVGDADAPNVARFFDLDYRGCRYSFGYPACPDVAEQQKMVPLLKPESIGVELSEEFQWHPEQSTAAVVAHHPEATYFAAR
jgi:5-methyltetrahydrofolate--homocysteine methyltransferase